MGQDVMRAVGLVLAVLIALIAVPARAQQSSDRAYWLVGTWSCRSMYNSVGTWTFVRNDDGSISLSNVFHPEGGERGNFLETYRFDSAAGVWRWSATRMHETTVREYGIAAPWTGADWIYDAHIPLDSSMLSGSIGQPRTRSEQVRIVYTMLDDATFQRKLESMVSGKWTLTNGSICKRQ
jgi:hypothetical protein